MEKPRHPCPLCGAEMRWKGLREPECPNPKCERYVASATPLTDLCAEGAIIVHPEHPVYHGVRALMERVDAGQQLPYLVDRDTLVAIFQAWDDAHLGSPETFYSPDELAGMSPEQKAEQRTDMFITYLTTQGAS